MTINDEEREVLVRCLNAVRRALTEDDQAIIDRLVTKAQEE